MDWLFCKTSLNFIVNNQLDDAAYWQHCRCFVPQSINTV